MGDTMKKLALMTVLSAFVGMGHAAQPYAAWTKYREVTINTTTSGGGADVATAQANFPVLVRLTNTSDATGANVLSEALAGGADIRFTDSTGNTALAYEIDSWSATMAAIWVRVPSVAGNGSTKVRVYWNRSGAPSASNGSGVFSASNGYVGVWHMGNPAGGSAQTGVRPNSKAPGVNDATPVSLPASSVVSGVIGLTDTLGGGGAHLSYGTLPAELFQEGGTATLSTWAYAPDAMSGWVQYFTMGNTEGGAGSGSMWLGRRGTGTNSIGAQNITESTNTGVVTAPNNALLPAEWQYIAFTVNDQDHILYSQGAEVGSSTSGPILASVERTANYIGWGTWSADATFPGKLDEPRVSNVARSADWVKLEYATQKPAATAVTLGATQAQAAPQLAYITKSATYLVNQAIGNNTAVTSGAASAFSIAPALPAGLSINSSNGTISGTPTAASSAAQYIVSATVGGSSAKDTLSIAVSAGTPPGAPTGVTAVGGNAQAVISWSPATAGSAAITVYKALAVEDTAKSCTWTTGALSCTITGLTNGTAYTFVVRATSDVGNGPLSVASAPVTPATVPGSPTAVTATPASSASTPSVQVSWTAPTSDGGSAVLSYSVTGAPSGSCFALPPATTCTVTGLSAGAYTFSVRAISQVGNSEPSAPSASVTSIAKGEGFAFRIAGSQPFAFVLPQGSESITLSIADVWGRAVWSRTVRSKDGVREVSWNGRSSNGRLASAGMYVARVTVLKDGVSTNLVQRTVTLKP